MKLDKNDYKNKLEEYYREQYNTTPHKPEGMYGTMAFFKVKEREFKDKLRAEGYEIE